MLACKLKAFQSPAEEDARRQFCRVWSDGVNQHSDATDDRIVHGALAWAWYSGRRQRQAADINQSTTDLRCHGEVAS